VTDNNGLLVVLPVLVAETADVCIESILRPDSSFGIPPEDILVVDNSRDGFAAKYQEMGFRYYRHPEGFQLGTSRAWNIGAREVLAEGLDYLVILSASVMFGPVKNATWLWQMERVWNQERVCEAEGLSWHCIALHRCIFETVGLFDENYWCYVEAEDMSYRMRQVGWEGGWYRAWVNAVSTRVAGHLQYFSVPFEALDSYRRLKFGGTKGEELWTHPFGDKPLDYWPEVTIPELAERYGMGPRFDRWW